MKFLVILIMLVALFLLYRIAYPKKAGAKKNNKAQAETPKTLPDVMGKSRFVLPDRSKPLQTPATSEETEKEAEKAYIFAAEAEEKQSAVIPPERMDEVFGEETEPMMSIPLEDEKTEKNETAWDAEEESEELKGVMGYEPQYADGVDYEALQTVTKVVKQQPDEVNEETCRTLAALENTDMFEMLVSGNEGKGEWIKRVIERNLQSRTPDTEDTTSDTDYGDFEIADFLS